MLSKMDAALQEAREVLDAAVRGAVTSRSMEGRESEQNTSLSGNGSRSSDVEAELNRRFFPGDSTQNLFVPSRWNPASGFYRHLLSSPFSVDVADHDQGADGSQNKRKISSSSSCGVRLLSVTYTAESSIIASREQAAPPPPPKQGVTNDSFGLEVRVPPPNRKQELLSQAPDKIQSETVGMKSNDRSPGDSQPRPSPQNRLTDAHFAASHAQDDPREDSHQRVVIRESTVAPGTQGSSPGGRKSVLKPGEMGLSGRFINSHCNASNVSTPALLVGIAKVLREGTSAQGVGPTKTITSINISNTKIGQQGPRTPPVRFDARGAEVNPPPNAERVADLGGYWIDEAAVGIDGVARRSLALALMMPLLSLSSNPATGNRYQITEFVADNCGLTDSDAIGLAALIREPLPRNSRCFLTFLSLRNNLITNAGADALKKAVKYNRTICEVRLDGNRDISDFDILRTMEKRLAENRKNTPPTRSTEVLAAESPQTTTTSAAVANGISASPDDRDVREASDYAHHTGEQLRGAGNTTGTSASSPGRKSILRPGEAGLSSRFLGHRCNASNITTVALLVGVSRVISSNKQVGTSASLCKGVITYLNLSNTKLGLQGPRKPPVRFDENNKEIDPPAAARTVEELAGYWVDERSAGVSGIAKRSLALAIVMPLLHISRPERFQIKELVADNCDLNDGDAQGIAAVLRMVSENNKSPSYLEVLSLRNNLITNAGADALKKAVKYNRTICELRLDGNRDISDFDILRTMEKRLAENRTKRVAVSPQNNKS
jgi:hypothetical protein